MSDDKNKVIDFVKYKKNILKQKQNQQLPSKKQQIEATIFVIAITIAAAILSFLF